MARPLRITPQSARDMTNYVSGLITEAARLREQAFERAAAGDRTVAADLHKDAKLVASIAVSFRYELADAHADTNDADSLIAALDMWPQ
ncbi:hypothetical protein [Sphingorhabdus sp. M41]|uniref:hypothetical protein n=1 Tax=Sphingorhabdus sp. M41 TaxID=1806885 RepID=UPI0018D4BA6E|nr:hypothetical protein [Sphingorhabdus sp. M41]